MDEKQKRQHLIDLLNKQGVQDPAKLATDRMVKKALRRLEANGIPDGLSDALAAFVRDELGFTGKPAEALLPPREKEEDAPVENIFPSETAKAPTKKGKKKAPAKEKTEKKETEPKEKAPIPDFANGQTFVCKGREASGKGRYAEGGFLILKNSVASPKVAPSAEDSLVPLRGELISSGVIVKDDGVLKFVQNYLCRTPSGAASVLLGSSVNGKICWKNSEGKTLKDLGA